MRTGIYVHKRSTVTIRTAAARPGKLELLAYREQRANRPAIGTHRLPPGIYKVESTVALEVTGANIEVVTMAGDKDSWPDPKVNVIALEPKASAASIKEWFRIAKTHDA